MAQSGRTSESTPGPRPAGQEGPWPTGLAGDPPLRLLAGEVVLIAVRLDDQARTLERRSLRTLEPPCT
ncbi:MAG: hypothetical protein ACK5E6_05280, partial [Cyanobacteriota bacterium]